jgi:hypothetical protein
VRFALAGCRPLCLDVETCSSAISRTLPTWDRQSHATEPRPWKRESSGRVHWQRRDGACVHHTFGSTICSEVLDALLFLALSSFLICVIPCWEYCLLLVGTVFTVFKQ